MEEPSAGSLFRSYISSINSQLYQIQFLHRDTKHQADGRDAYAGGLRTSLTHSSTPLRLRPSEVAIFKNDTHYEHRGNCKIIQSNNPQFLPSSEKNLMKHWTPQDSSTVSPKSDPTVLRSSREIFSLWAKSNRSRILTVSMHRALPFCSVWIPNSNTFIH